MCAAKRTHTVSVVCNVDDVQSWAVPTEESSYRPVMYGVGERLRTECGNDIYVSIKLQRGDVAHEEWRRGQKPSSLCRARQLLRKRPGESEDGPTERIITRCVIIQHPYLKKTNVMAKTSAGQVHGLMISCMHFTARTIEKGRARCRPGSSMRRVRDDSHFFPSRNEWAQR